MSYYLDGEPYSFISVWVFFIFISLQVWVFFIFIWLIVVSFIFVWDIFFFRGLFMSRGSLDPGRAVVTFGSSESLGLEDNGIRGQRMSFDTGR